jgi:peptidoglycan hydrolase-like amidase
MCLSCLLALPFLFSSPALPSEGIVRTFETPVDAVSVTLPEESATADVSYFADGAWSDWETLSVENEQDPLLKESNLMMFPEPVTKIRIKSETTFEVQPITVSREPVRYQVAATKNTGTPRVLSRKEWGANDSMLFRKESDKPSNETPEENGGNNSGAIPARVQECNTAQFNYPDEFKIKKTETTDSSGRIYRWPLQYSKSVELLAVHHTAVKGDGDTRSGAERVRALYEYHANNRGWGDVGYHYLIDEDGQIYEGKAGGKYVVAGHAYCNNIGTVGVALLGNFEVEEPSQEQLKALQWLLKDLTDTYNIDPSKNIQFHGKTMPPIVGHRDLLSTDCPGFYAYGTLNEIRKHVASGDVDASVKIPVKAGTVPKSSKKSSSSKRSVSSKKSSAISLPKRSTGELSRAAQRALNRQGSTLLLRKLRRGVASQKSASSKSVSRRPVTVRSSASSSKKSVVSRASSSRRSIVSNSSPEIRIRLTRKETGETNCSAYNLDVLRTKFRGSIECTVVDGIAALINTVTLEDYMTGLAEEPDTEPYEKQRAFAIAARTYAAYYMDPSHLRKFPGKPYDGSDSPATFQLYGGKDFEANNPRWVKAVKDTANEVLTFKGQIIRAPYFSGDDGRTRTPAEAGWNNFPFAEIFTSKDDPWCAGDTLRGHGVGMSGCGSEGQANEGKSGEEILKYYYPGTTIMSVSEARS